MEFNYLPAELPCRAWKEYEACTGENQVSLLLSVAWAVFVVPTERLDFLASSNPHHASDGKSTNEIPKSLVELWEEKKTENVSNLKRPEGIYSFDDRGNLKPPGTNDWRSQILVAKNLNAQPTYADLVSVLRHGLSHGNIWTDNKKDYIENIYIANYPPIKKMPVQVLHITDGTLYTLVGEFVKWYSKATGKCSGKEQLASLPMDSDDEPGAMLAASSAPVCLQRPAHAAHEQGTSPYLLFHLSPSAPSA